MATPAPSAEPTPEPAAAPEAAAPVAQEATAEAPAEAKEEEQPKQDAAPAAASESLVEPARARPSPFEPQLPSRNSPSIKHIARIPQPPPLPRPANPRPRPVSDSEQSDTYTDSYRNSAFLPTLRVAGRPRPNVRRAAQPGEAGVPGRAILMNGYSRGGGNMMRFGAIEDDSDGDDVDGEGMPFGEIRPSQQYSILGDAAKTEENIERKEGVPAPAEGEAKSAEAEAAAVASAGEAVGSGSAVAPPAAEAAAPDTTETA